MKSTIIVIPAEGDSAETEIWYIKAIRRHYKVLRRDQPEILVFEHDGSEEAVKLGVAMSTQVSVHKFIEEHDFEAAEIHAQGGLGAYVACEFLRQYELRYKTKDFGREITLTNVFLVGGAPSDTMTPIAKWFHRSYIKFWYRIRFIVPFFADDPPNPECKDEIAKIKEKSTQTMRANPELYRNQLLHIGNWRIAEGWCIPAGVKVWYVPNGVTLRNESRDMPYDDEKAKACWAKHGVRLTERPGRNFSFYTMMPAHALLSVIDKVL